MITGRSSRAEASMPTRSRPLRLAGWLLIGGFALVVIDFLMNFFHAVSQQEQTAENEDQRTTAKDESRYTERAHLQAKGDFRKARSDKRNCRKGSKHRTKRDDHVNRNRPLSLVSVPMQKRKTGGAGILGAKSKRRIFRHVGEKDQQYQTQTVTGTSPCRLHQVRCTYSCRRIQDAWANRFHDSVASMHHDTFFQNAASTECLP